MLISLGLARWDSYYFDTAGITRSPGGRTRDRRWAKGGAEGSPRGNSRRGHLPSLCAGTCCPDLASVTDVLYVYAVVLFERTKHYVPVLFSEFFLTRVCDGTCYSNYWCQRRCFVRNGVIGVIKILCSSLVPLNSLTRVIKHFLNFPPPSILTEALEQHPVILRTFNMKQYGTFAVLTFFQRGDAKPFFVWLCVIYGVLC